MSPDSHYWVTVYPKKFAYGFVVLCFVVVMQSFIMNSHEVFIHIHQGCFAGTGAIVRLPQCQWSKPDGYGKISQCITTTKHSKAKTVCIFLGIYCTIVWPDFKSLQFSLEIGACFFYGYPIFKWVANTSLHEKFRGALPQNDRQAMPYCQISERAIITTPIIRCEYYSAISPVLVPICCFSRCWIIVNFTVENILQWKSNRNTQSPLIQ